MEVFAVEFLVVNSQLDNNNKIKPVNYIWMIKLPTKWNPVQCIISQNDYSTNPAQVTGSGGKMFIQTILGNAAAKGSTAPGLLIILEYWFWPKQVIMNTLECIWYDMKHSKNKQKQRMMKCWTSLWGEPVCYQCFFVYVFNEVFAHLCSYLVSKAL